MPRKLPSAYTALTSRHPALMRAYEALGEASIAEGPLDRRTAELVKLGIAVGARLEGALHSHVRRAAEAGASDDEIRHAVRLAVTTVGFPTMMAALTWTDDVLGRAGARGPGGRRARTRPPKRRATGRRRGGGV
jgi:alkylhydroperoxidase/carboxymuconolactone decarboxylase family protein YurZ